ncbi:hypothetical protein KHF85_15355 [Xanthomonas translucens pv. graminis]|uniref:hypothetical protein n=1 Tax=Xanthomonas graminis TaxID=3390026 RepID=UPI0025411896|nr:hypothetical protein [Xanthomonas translucens]WIH04176.1 hypothetical protein KHF85_15355 [Xanthomonas translucens pv. graminis]
MTPRWQDSRAQLSAHVQGLLRLATTAVPALYLSGRMFADAYWSALGMGALPLSYASDDYIYMGLLALTWSAASLFGIGHDQWLAAVALGGVGLGLAALLGWHLLGALRRWLRRRAVAHPAGGERRISAETLVLAFAMVVAPLVLAALAARQEGARHASQRMQQLAAAARPGGIATRADTAGASAGVLDCNGRWCVVWQQGRPVAVPIDTILRFQARRALADAASVRSAPTCSP